MKKVRTNTDYMRIYGKVLPRIKHSLIEWDFRDILRASSGGAKRGAFILASCYIDHLTCYYFGGDSTKKRYIDFVDRFLPRYSGKDLYVSMRSKLVHNYSEGGKYVFTHNHYKLHLRQDKVGRTILNLNSFISDLKKATKLYFDTVEGLDEFKIKMARRYLNVGTLSSAPLQVQ